MLVVGVATASLSTKSGPKLHTGHDLWWPRLGLDAPSKVSQRLKRFSNGGALCKMKMAMPSQR